MRLCFKKCPAKAGLYEEKTGLATGFPVGSLEAIDATNLTGLLPENNTADNAVAETLERRFALTLAEKLLSGGPPSPRL